MLSCILAASAGRLFGVIASIPAAGRCGCLAVGVARALRLTRGWLCFRIASGVTRRPTVLGGLVSVRRPLCRLVAGVIGAKMFRTESPFCLRLLYGDPWSACVDVEVLHDGAVVVAVGDLTPDGVELGPALEWAARCTVEGCPLPPAGWRLETC